MSEYYSIQKLWDTGATYLMAIGMRSNGKTYQALYKALEIFATSGKQTAIIRRYQDDFRGKRGRFLFSPLYPVIEELFEGEWNQVIFKSNMWYLAREEENGDIVYCQTPFALAFSLTAQEHEKSASYNDVALCIFDEFLTRGYELPDEFVVFQNLLSTIIRKRDDVRILMLGNTVNQYSSYFDEMGLYNIRSQEQGTIDIYKYGDTELTVAVEYCENIDKHKKINKYFAFNNSKLEMITKGTWEINVYPRIPSGKVIHNPKFTFCIKYKENVVLGQIFRYDQAIYIAFTKKTTEIQDKTMTFDSDSIGSNKWEVNNIFLCNTKAVQNIRSLIFSKKTLYDSNVTGEIVRNWLMDQKTESKVI